MASIIVRPLGEEDRAAWEPLWAGYQAFYKVGIAADVTDFTWERLLDPAAPLHALGAFVDRRLGAIAHYIFHATTWSAGPRCYLNDIFTDEVLRGRGLGRRLIETIYEAARAAGADRVYWHTHETNLVAQKLYDRVADRSGFIQYRKML